MRTWNKYGAPDWRHPITEEEGWEIEGWVLSGLLPFTKLPPGSDLTNLVAFPLRRRELAKMVTLY
jgi:hypothetical protein